MKFIVTPLVFFTLLLAYLVSRSKVKYNKTVVRNQKLFWDRESEANMVRRADISDLEYIYLEPDTLPLSQAEDAGFGDLVNQLRALSDKNIINLSQYSNTDLKLMYGPANLNTLSEYDNNFTELIRLLNTLGEEMLKSGNQNAAEQFFKQGITLGSDISNTYVKLCEIYAATGNEIAIDNLISTAESLTSLAGSIIVTKLNNIKSGSK